jgi:hypothetical protein
MMTDTYTIEDALRAQLLCARHRDGGWGYEPGCVPRLEPTCWALLGLRTPRPQFDRMVLSRWPSSVDGLVEQHGGLVNWSFHALALVTRMATGDAALSQLRPLARALVDARGIAPTSTTPPQESRDGWSWIDGTFSWVEPTSWALLALKQCRARGITIKDIDRRIHDGDAIFVERMCTAGGWNYGDSPRFGRDLRAYVPTTASALLALQDRGDEPFVEQSLDYLGQHAENHPAIRALALSALALKHHGRPAARVDDQLRRWLDRHPTSDAASIGMALCALHEAAADVFAF